MEEKNLVIGVNLGGDGGQVGGDGEGGAGAGHPPDGWKPLLQVLKAFICLDYDDLPKQVNFKIDIFVRIYPKYLSAGNFSQFLKIANQRWFSPSD